MDDVIENFIATAETSDWPEVSLAMGEVEGGVRLVGWKTKIGDKSYGDAMFLHEALTPAMEGPIEEILAIQASRSYAKITGASWEPEMQTAVKFRRV